MSYYIINRSLTLYKKPNHLQAVDTFAVTTNIITKQMAGWSYIGSLPTGGKQGCDAI